MKAETGNSFALILPVDVHDNVAGQARPFTILRDRQGLPGFVTGAALLVLGRFRIKVSDAVLPQAHLIVGIVTGQAAFIGLWAIDRF
jgi:hypothetical protein